MVPTSEERENEGDGATCTVDIRTCLGVGTGADTAQASFHPFRVGVNDYHARKKPGRFSPMDRNVKRYCGIGAVCVLVMGCSGENGGGQSPSGGSSAIAGGGATSSALGGATAAASGSGGNDNIGASSGAGLSSSGGIERGGTGVGGTSAAGDNAAGASLLRAGSTSGGAMTGGRPACSGPGVPGAANTPNAATPLHDDRDGQTYATIKVGAQVWMAQNLNVGERVPGISEWPGQRDDSKNEKFCVDDLSDNCAIYGGLYTWPEAMGLSWQCAQQSCANQLGSPQRGICPAGWHIPTQAEWSTLAEGLAELTGLTTRSTEFADYWTELGLAMKSTNCWNDGGNGTNATGFNAIPAGWRHDWGGFNAVGGLARFHSTTELGPDLTQGRGFEDDSSAFFKAEYYEDHAVSVRCVKD